MAEIQPPMDGQVNDRAQAGSSKDTAIAKRQRRPSVRLGDIGAQTSNPSFDLLGRRNRNGQEYKHKKEPFSLSKWSKSQALMNYGRIGEVQETLEGEDKEGNDDGVSTGSWKIKDFKPKRGASKRGRPNWAPKVKEAEGEGNERFSGDDEDAEGYRGFQAEGSDSPIQSSDRVQELHFHGQRELRTQLLESREDEGMELEGPSDMDARDWRYGNDGVGRCESSEDVVRIWLESLGLARYCPVFEIHEVDVEVLPMLTLEDLKDMGINAVGSRRKMFSAIQKLGRGFS